MTFDLQDALELDTSAHGQQVRLIMRDGTELSGELMSYDLRDDSFRIKGVGRPVRRTKVENVIVLARMDKVIENFTEQGICGNGSESYDEHNDLLYGHKTGKPTLDMQEGNPTAWE